MMSFYNSRRLGNFMTSDTRACRVESHTGS